jgi:hypothetical protein
MSTTKNGWTVLDESTGALMYTYGFAKNAFANSMTARLSDGSLCVISPACHVDDAVLRDLEPFGPVRMIIAANAYHHMGLPQWSRAFPDARSYAHPKALKRVAKQHPSLNVQSIETVADKFGETAAVWSVPGMRSGDLWLKAGRSWYVGDQFMNFPEHVKGLFGFVFRVTGSTPGFKANGVSRAFFTADKKAYKSWALDQLAAQGPAQVVPGHGPLASNGAVAGEMKRQIEARF